MKLRIPFSILIISVFTIASVYAQDYSFRSPDKQLRLEVQTGQQLKFNLLFHDSLIIKDAEIGLSTNQFTAGKNTGKAKKRSASVDDVSFPLIAEKSKSIPFIYNEMSLSFKAGWSVVFRLYNNGFAYRFTSNKKGELIVDKEQAIFPIQGNFDVFYPEDKSFMSHYERAYPRLKFDSISMNSFCVLPALFDRADVKLTITETDVLDYPNMFLEYNGNQKFTAIFPPAVLAAENLPGKDRSEVLTNADYIAKTIGTRNFPWRIFMLEKNATALLSNQLPYLLAPEQSLDDVSWIQPGKVAWDWWNANNIYGVDFKSGINTETYKYYIDFAAKFNIPYIILDEGWSKTTDVLEVVPEIDMKELSTYAQKKGVGIILWVLWKPLLEQIDEAMEQYELWNIRGIKVDFMQRADQQMVNYYEEIARKAALHKLIVDFHGAYKPSGLRRKYPNVLTYEGVQGLENVKWSKKITPTHDVTLPFTRMLAGPMDYTPGAMRNAHKQDYHISWNRPMSMGTRAHQAALYIVFESPLQMLCDNPSNYLKEPEYTKFIADIPVVWDQSFSPMAEIGKFIVMSRKKGNHWYIGALNNEEARTLTINTDFLDDGIYEIHFLKDGPNADRMAEDHKFGRKAIKKGENITIKMESGGGYVAVLKKVL